MGRFSKNKSEKNFIGKCLPWAESSVRKTMALLALTLTLILPLVACGDSRAGTTVPGLPSGNPIKATETTETEESEESVTETETQEGIYLIQKMDMDTEKITLRDVTTDRVYRYSYTLGTEFKDRYGQSKSWDSFQRGRAVEIETEGISGVLTSVQLTDRVWEREDVSNFTLDLAANRLYIGENYYRITDQTEVYSNDEVATLLDITETDTLRVVAYDNIIYSLTVTTGHGYIQLVNTKLFLDSMVQVGNKIFTKISEEGMRIEVQEGTYALTVANGGYGGTTEVSVPRNSIQVVDLDTLKGEGPKTCTITFNTTVEGAKIYIDNTEVSPSEPAVVNYGAHRLTVVADGYDTWVRTLIVNSAEAEILLDPTTTTESSSSDDSDEDASSDSSSSTSGSSSSDSSNSSGSDSSSSSSSTSAAEATVDYLTTLSDMMSTLMSN